MLVQVTGENIEEEILKSDKPAVLDFWAPWCGHCKMIAPVLEKLANEKAGIVKIGKVDVDKEHKLAERYSVTALPTFIFFQDGKPVYRIVGIVAPKYLKEKIDELILHVV